MKMKCVALCFLLAGSVRTAEETDSNTVVTANLNDYVDEVLPSLRTFMVNNGLDPMEIPDMVEGFSVRPLLIVYHGELVLTEGYLHNLKSLRRSGDTLVSYQNMQLSIKGDFGVDHLDFDYEYLAKIMGIGPRGGVKGAVSKASFLTDFIIDFNSNEVHLNDFYIHDVGTIDVRLTGNILIDYLSNAVIKVITVVFKNVILNNVESNIKKALEDYIRDINNSVGGARKFLEDIAGNN